MNQIMSHRETNQVAAGGMLKGGVFLAMAYLD